MDDKGQISSLDLVVAALVFIGILFSAVYLWSNTVTSISRSGEKADLDAKVRDVSEALVKTSGEPPNWEELPAATIKYPAVKSLGLAKDDNILDQAKIDKCGQINYEDARYLLGLSREQYNLTIINSTGEVTHSSGHPVAGQSSAADRIVLINGAKSKLRLILFAQEV